MINLVELSKTLDVSNKLRNLKIIIDAGSQIESRMQLEKAAVQFASAYRGMKTSIFFTGTDHKQLRDRFSLENAKYKEIISHIHDFVRGNLRTPRIFDNLVDGIELLRELISMRVSALIYIII